MSRTPAGLELAIKRLELMRERCNQTPPPKTHESMVPLLTANAEAVALTVAIEALRRELRAAGRVNFEVPS